MIFKFPYLKNECNDMHFDLSDPDQLIGKNLLWFSRYIPLTEEKNRNIRLIGSIFFGNYVLAKRLLQATDIFSSTVAVCRSKLEEIANKTNDIKELQYIQPSENAVEELKVSENHKNSFFV